MSRTMATDSLSMTGGGAALVTDPGGSIESTDVAGLFVEDVRALSRWRIDPDLTAQLVGRVRLGPSSDRLVWTLSAPGAADPVATFERTRTVVAAGLREELAICPFIAPLTCTLRMHAACDERSIFAAGDVAESSNPSSPSSRRRPPAGFCSPDRPAARRPRSRRRDGDSITTRCASMPKLNPARRGARR